MFGTAGACLGQASALQTAASAYAEGAATAWPTLVRWASEMGLGWRTLAEELIPFQAPEQMMSTSDVGKLARATRQLVNNKAATQFEGIRDTIETVRCKYPKAFF